MMLFASGGGGEYLLMLDLGVWSLMVFLILFVGLGAAVLPQLYSTMKVRQQNVKASLEQAVVAREEAKRLLAEQAVEREKAKVRVTELLDEAKRDAARVEQEVAARAKDEVERGRTRTQREIALVQAKALHELWDLSAKISFNVANEILAHELTEDDHRRMIEQSIVELEQAIGGPA